MQNLQQIKTGWDYDKNTDLLESQLKKRKYIICRKGFIGQHGIEYKDQKDRSRNNQTTPKADNFQERQAESEDSPKKKKAIKFYPSTDGNYFQKSFVETKKDMFSRNKSSNLQVKENKFSSTSLYFGHTF